MLARSVVIFRARSKRGCAAKQNSSQKYKDYLSHILLN